MEMKFSELEICSMIEYALTNGGAPVMLAEGWTVTSVKITNQSKNVNIHVEGPDESRGSSSSSEDDDEEGEEV